MFYDTPKTSFHPGSYLQELLIWHNISPEKLADTMGMPKTKIVDITEKRRGIDKTISEGLAAYFGNSAQFWLDLQEHFDHRD
jgi:addiction module HigA family antidote